MNHTKTTASGALLLLVTAAAPAAGQGFFDWPVRASAAPEALATGAAAPFGNPAAAAELARRGEALVVDVVGPDEVGVNGLAAGGAYRLLPALTLAAGYVHLGIEGIHRTTTSPTEYEPGDPEVSVGEDRITLAAALAPGERLRVGGAVRYARVNRYGGGGGGVAVGGGVFYRPPLPFPATVAAAGYAGGNDPHWMIGVEAGAPETVPGEPRVRYGVLRGRRGERTHRVALESRWRERFSLALGVDGEPTGQSVHWAPLAAAEVRVGSYALGVLREELPNGFGAAYYYRLSVTF